MKEDLIRHGWPSSKISVVWNGVDPQKYNPEKCSREDIKRIRLRYGIKDDEFMLLFLGRLTWVKGVRNLLQAMPLIIEEYPQTKLVILGKGEEQRDVLETAARLGIPHKVACRFEFVSEKERILHYAQRTYAFSHQSTNPSESSALKPCPWVNP
jgi:1,4-alpha-glucan branching enzyme